jgi:hypothetical protein
MNCGVHVENLVYCITINSENGDKFKYRGTDASFDVSS